MDILYVSNSVKSYTLAYQIDMGILVNLGHTVTWAANFEGFLEDRRIVPCNMVSIDIYSYPTSKKNIIAYKQLIELSSKHRFDALICTTPIGGTLGRIVAQKSHIPLVIYSVHGFLFFKGMSLPKWFVFRVHELLFARMTDCIITITDEDYEAAKKFKLRNNGQVYCIHGAGIEIGVKPTRTRKQIRQELNLSEDEYVIISAGYLNANKNNRVMIEAMSLIKDPRIVYLVCGEGNERPKLERMVTDLQLCDRVKFLGFRSDIADLMNASDLFVMPSYREGVPRSLLEAMDLGLPCIGSCTRGIRELLENGKGGILCNPNSPEEFASGIRMIKENPSYRKQFTERNKKILNSYSKERVQSELESIYKKVLR